MDEAGILYSVLKFSTAALARGITGLVIYLLISWLLKSEELFNFWDGVKRRLLYKKVETRDQGEARGI